VITSTGDRRDGEHRHGRAAEPFGHRVQRAAAALALQQIVDHQRERPRRGRLAASSSPRIATPPYKRPPFRAGNSS